MVASASEHETRSRPDLPELRGKRHCYSILRGLSLIADGKEPDGLEGEVHRELARKRSKDAKGLIIPWDAPIERRGLDMTTGAGSIQTTRPKVLIDILRPKLALARLGADIRDFGEGTPSGTILIPAKATAANTQWVNNDSFTPQQSNLTTTGVVMTPKTVTAYTDVTRRFLTLANTATYEDLVIDDLVQSAAIALDAAGINGSGQGNTPLGLFQHSEIPYITESGGSANGNAPTYVDMCSMESKLGVNNGDAPAGARIGFLTSPQGRGALRAADMGSNSGRKVWRTKLMQIDGELVPVETCIGYPAVASTNVSASITMGSGSNLTMGLMGNFRDLLINLFTGLDVLINPYRQSADGTIRVSIFQDVDVAVRHANSFVLGVGWITPTVA